MKFNYLVQDEYDVIDKIDAADSNKLKDPVTVTITIELEKSKYESIQKKYKEPIGCKIQKLFK